jgi:hypothetical protein
MPVLAELLDNVELRFALAESDVQLEKTLNTFLCPMLLKLASPAENVRAKVNYRCPAISLILAITSKISHILHPRILLMSTRSLAY